VQERWVRPGNEQFLGDAAQRQDNGRTHCDPENAGNFERMRGADLKHAPGGENVFTGLIGVLNC
jgi:hypothetical protein